MTERLKSELGPEANIWKKENTFQNTGSQVWTLTPGAPESPGNLGAVPMLVTLPDLLSEKF